METTRSVLIPAAGGDTLPYPPSFVDRIIDLVERLPGPYWLTLAALFLAHTALAHALAWMDGWLPAYTFNATLLMFPVWLWGPLAMMRTLNSTAAGALAGFRPLLGLEADRPDRPETLERLRHELTTMPARPVIVSGVLWSLVYGLLTVLGYDAVYVAYGFGPVFSAIVFVSGLVTFFVGSAIYYHSLRQLRLVSRTLKQVKRLSLFDLEPVYAFSRLTARTGVAWVFLLTVSLLTFPMNKANGAVLAVQGLQLVLAVAAFVLPLRSANTLLVAEKRRLLAEVNGHIDRTLERLYGSLDGQAVAEQAQMATIVNGLNTQRARVNDVSTWPWRAGTFNFFLSAIVVPIVVVLVKFLVESLVGG